MRSPSPGRRGLRGVVRCGAAMVLGAVALAACGDDGTTTRGCTTTYVDSKMAFGTAVSNGMSLKVGAEAYWSGRQAAGMVVTGPGVVTLRDESAATRIVCGVSQGTVTWVTVTGKRTGAVTISRDGQQLLTLTVIAR